MPRTLVALLAAGVLAAAGCGPAGQKAINDLASLIPSQGPSPEATAAGKMPWPAPAHITGHLEQVDGGKNDTSTWHFALTVDVRIDVDSAHSSADQVSYKDAGTTWTISGTIDENDGSKVCHTEVNSSGAFPDDSMHSLRASLEPSLTSWGLLFEVGNDLVPDRETCNGITHDAFYAEGLTCQAEWVSATTFKSDGYCDVPDQITVKGTLTGS